MLAAHHPSRQTRGGTAAWLVAIASLVSGCASNELPPTIWPPADFAFEAEQIALAGDGAQVQRRVRVTADGLVVYGTASESLRRRSAGEAGSIVALPVFDRLAVYRLEPNCVRAFARRLDRLGLATMAPRQGETTDVECTIVVLQWRAFGAQNRVLVQGRTGGPLAELLGVVTSHLPTGERFDLPGEQARVVEAVLRAVPSPATDLGQAFAVHERLCDEASNASAGLLLDTYVLACANGARARAEQWLTRWATASAAAATTAEPSSLDRELLQRFLPPQ